MTTGTPDDLAALREGAAFCSPDLRFPVQLTGGDVLPWLDRISSNPVAGIGEGRYVLATLMDGKGRMRADMRVIAPGPPAEGILLDLPASHRAQLMRLLDMYIINDDVTFTDLSAELRFASVLGPGAADVLQGAGIECPGEERVGRPRDDVYVMPSRLAGIPGWDLLFDGTVGRDLVDDLFAAGAVRVDTAALDVVRVSQGVLSTEGECPLDPGTELTGTGEQDGRTVGILTSAAFDAGSGLTNALGYARRAAWKDGTLVRAGDVELTVHTLGDA
jgi:folate-binding Fe-S cluster repair protein YgfZ